MKNQLKAGVILSYISTVITIAIQLIYMPVMIRLLGKSEYGLYSLVSSVVSYLSLFSLGFTGAYVRFFAKSCNNKEKLASLNGMFLIDDTKDSDFTNTHGKENNEEKLSRIKGTGLSESQIKRLYAIAAKANVEKSMVLKAIKQEFKVEKAELLTKDQYDELCARLEKKIINKI